MDFLVTCTESVIWQFLNFVGWVQSVWNCLFLVCVWEGWGYVCVLMCVEVRKYTWVLVLKMATHYIYLKTIWEGLGGLVGGGVSLEVGFEVLKGQVRPCLPLFTCVAVRGHLSGAGVRSPPTLYRLSCLSSPSSLV